MEQNYYSKWYECDCVKSVLNGMNVVYMQDSSAVQVEPDTYLLTYSMEQGPSWEAS